ncbi:MAG: ABC transporter substrate-binding protein [Proteobacteria bacterium]|nr:ABC transporter substrate-binding protein [Pseudomonadota bacterium]
MRHRVLLAAVLSLALPLAAPAADTIKVGASQPITGRFAFAGVNINQGLADALENANEKGGVKGRKFEYIFEDSGYQVDKAVAVFKKIMAESKPVMFYGESTGQGKAIAPELNKTYKVLYGSTSFSSELADPATYPYTFVSGPTYSDMFGILLEYIAKNPKGAKPTVAFFYSDTEFGKDPIEYGRKRAAELGVEVVAEIVAKVGAVDVTSEVLELTKKKPQYVIFQGFVLSPIAEVIRGARDYGLDTTFMGTFWSMSEAIIQKLGEDASGYLGVNPYAYYDDTDVPMVREMRAFNAKHHPDAKTWPNSYVQGWFTGMVFVKCAEICVDKGWEITGDNLVKALETIKDWDVGGLMPPVTFVDHKVPMGRVYKADAAQKKFVPASDWIRLK